MTSQGKKSNHRRLSMALTLLVLAVLWFLVPGAVLGKEYVVPFDLVKMNFRLIQEPKGDFALRYTVPDEFAQAFEQEGHELKVRKKVEKYLSGRRDEIHRLMQIYDKQLAGLENGWSRQNILVSKKKRKAQIESVIDDFNKDYQRVRTDIAQKLEKRLLKEFDSIRKKSEAIDDKAPIGKTEIEVDDDNFDVDDDFEKEALSDKKKKKSTRGRGDPGEVTEAGAEAARKYHGAVVSLKKRLGGLDKAVDDLARARKALNDAVETMRKSSSSAFEKNAKDLDGPIDKFTKGIKAFEAELAEARKACDETLEIVNAAQTKKAKTRKKIELAKKRVEATRGALKGFNRLLNQGKHLVGTARSFMKADKENKIKKDAMGMVKKGRAWQEAMETANKSVQSELAGYK